MGASIAGPAVVAQPERQQPLPEAAARACRMGRPRPGQRRADRQRVRPNGKEERALAERRYAVVRDVQDARLRRVAEPLQATSNLRCDRATAVGQDLAHVFNQNDPRPEEVGYVEERPEQHVSRIGQKRVIRAHDPACGRCVGRCDGRGPR